MWRPAYKQRCLSCKKNMVLIKHPRQRAICQECQMKSISTPITDPKFIKLFNVDPALYEQSSFLRDVRYQYGRFGNLSEKQVSAFERVVKEITDKAAADAQAAQGKPSAKPVRVPRPVRKGLDPFGASHHVTPLPPKPVKPAGAEKKEEKPKKKPVKKKK